VEALSVTQSHVMTSIIIADISQIIFFNFLIFVSSTILIRIRVCLYYWGSSQKFKPKHYNPIIIC